MRQYNKLKSEKKENFTYKDMKPFYIIVLMSNSSSAFLDVSPTYIHNEQTTYDSGAKVTSLSHIKYISLDTFHKTVHNITNKLDAGSLSSVLMNRRILYLSSMLIHIFAIQGHPKMPFFIYSPTMTKGTSLWQKKRPYFS